jgi:transposase
VANSPKKGEHEGRTIVFVDEAGFQLLPTVVRTYAPRGETPVLPETATKEHLSVISGVTRTGELWTQSQDESFKGPAVVRFLAHLQRCLGPKLLVAWDRASIHRGEPVREFLAAQPAAGIEVVLLPGYAPELNPDEGVWRYLKHQLANVSCPDLAQLRRELRRATERLRHRPDLIRSFFAEAGYG